MLDSPLEQEKYFSNNFKINESVPVYLDEEREGELHLIPSPHFFNRFFASDEEKNQNIVQLYDKKPNGRNLKKIIFGENDIKTMPWRFYDDFSDRNVNYEIIDNLGHDYFSEDNFIDIKASLKEVKDISCQDIEK